MHRTHSFFGFYLYSVYNCQISGLKSNYGYFLLNDCRNNMKKKKLKIFYEFIVFHHIEMTMKTPYVTF